MEQIKIIVNTNNSAFDESVNEDLARVLRNLAHKIEQGQKPSFLRNINGNIVGKVSYTGL